MRGNAFAIEKGCGERRKNVLPVVTRIASIVYAAANDEVSILATTDDE